MMFAIAVAERVRIVSVVRKGALLHVTLDGRTHVVDARRVADDALSMLVQNGHPPAVRSIDAAFASGREAGEFDVHLLGRAIPVEVRPSTRWGRRADAPGSLRAASGGPQKVVSPMPGKIVRVLVKPGDQVTARQGLVVVEAMKMENELRAPRDGRVREVSAAEGQSVEAGAVLVVVE
jgi:biotin carboxyl carrier protein